MTISIEIPGALERQLAEAASRLGVSPEELAVAALRDLLSRPDDDFERAVEYVLRKNHELYLRLA